MKKIISLLFFAIALIGLECKGQGKPFADYKDEGYTLGEAAKIISKDSVLVNDYRNLFQQIAEKDGWIGYVSGKEISRENTIFLIGNLKVTNDNWDIGDVVISSRNGKTTKHFTRPSYSDRGKKTKGLEQVAQLDITAITGWEDNRGNPFPVRDVMCMVCVNSIYDQRVNIKPVSFAKVSFKDRDTLIIMTHDTIWMEPNDVPKYQRSNYWPANNNDYYYQAPTYCPVFSMQYCCPNYTAHCESSSTYNYYNYTYTNTTTVNTHVTNGGQGGHVTNGGQGGHVTNGGHDGAGSSGNHVTRDGHDGAGSSGNHVTRDGHDGEGSNVGNALKSARGDNNPRNSGSSQASTASTVRVNGKEYVVTQTKGNITFLKEANNSPHQPQDDQRNVGRASYQQPNSRANAARYIPPSQQRPQNDQRNVSSESPRVQQNQAPSRSSHQAPRSNPSSRSSNGGSRSGNQSYSASVHSSGPSRSSGGGGHRR